MDSNNNIGLGAEGVNTASDTQGLAAETGVANTVVILVFVTNVVITTSR